MSIYRYRCVLFAWLTACLHVCNSQLTVSHIPRATWEVCVCQLSWTGTIPNPHALLWWWWLWRLQQQPKTLLFLLFYTIVKNYKIKWHSGENKNNSNGLRHIFSFISSFGFLYLNVFLFLVHSLFVQYVTLTNNRVEDVMLPFKQEPSVA